jgi:hypothetical protein
MPVSAIEQHSIGSKPALCSYLYLLRPGGNAFQSDHSPTSNSLFFIIFFKFSQIRPMVLGIKKLAKRPM